MYGEAFMQEFNATAVAERLATHHNVDVDALRKTPEQKQQEAAMQQQANMMDKVAAPAVGAVTKGIADSVNSE